MTGALPRFVEGRFADIEDCTVFTAHFTDYIEAHRADWRPIDLPGLRLNRGGSAEGHWYIMPEVGLPCREWLERYADGVEILADGNEIYMICELLRGYDTWVDSLFPPENICTVHGGFRF